MDADTPTLNTLPHVFQKWCTTGSTIVVYFYNATYGRTSLKNRPMEPKFTPRIQSIVYTLTTGKKTKTNDCEEGENLSTHERKSQHPSVGRVVCAVGEWQFAHFHEAGGCPETCCQFCIAVTKNTLFVVHLQPNNKHRNLTSGDERHKIWVQLVV